MSQEGRSGEKAWTESELDRLLSDFYSGSLGKRPFLSAASTFPLGCLIVCVSALVACNAVFFHPVIMLPAIAVGLILPFFLNRFVAGEAKRRDVIRLAIHNDVRVVPPMIEVLTWPESELRDEASNALVRLLPLVTEADANLLQTRHRQILRDQLSNYVLRLQPNDRLITAILTALVQVGTQGDLPAVNAIVSRPNMVLRDKAMLERAQALIPILTARTHGPDTLLRAADSVPNQVLLRPAGDSSHTDSSSLLRPADEEKPVE